MQELMSGKLLATKDSTIFELLADPDYDVREDGTIWTIVCRTGKRSTKNIWREAGTTRDGYREIKYQRAALRVHRIIFQKFLGPLREDMVINHKNGNRSDNRPSNLELVSQAENNLHRYRVLKRPPVFGNTTLDWATVRSIRAEYHLLKTPYSHLMRKYPGLTSKGHASEIINNKIWIEDDLALLGEAIEALRADLRIPESHISCVDRAAHSRFRSRT